MHWWIQRPGTRCPEPHYKSQVRGQKFHSSTRNYEWNLDRTSNSSQSTRPIGTSFWKNYSRKSYNSLMSFIAYAFKGQVHVFAGRVKIFCKSLVLQDKCYIEIFLSPASCYNWATTWDFQQCGMCDQQSLRSVCAYAQSDQSLCLSLEYSMNVKLLTEHLLEFLSLKGGCTGLSESSLGKMPHYWKSHVVAQLCFLRNTVMDPLEKGHTALCELPWWLQF